MKHLIYAFSFLIISAGQLVSQQKSPSFDIDQASRSRFDVTARAPLNRSQSPTLDSYDDSIRVQNPQLLNVSSLPAVRTPAGIPWDYKPSAVQLTNGELLMSAFSWIEASDTSYQEDIILFRSADGGQTWIGGATQAGFSGREPYLTLLSDGTLLMTGVILPADIRNSTKLIRSFVWRSTDNGHSWEVTEVIPDSLPGMHIITTRNILELKDGSLLLGLSGPQLPTKYNFFWRSFDGGSTWIEKYPSEVDSLPAIIGGFFSRKRCSGRLRATGCLRLPESITRQCRFRATHSPGPTTTSSTDWWSSTRMTWDKAGVRGRN